MVLLPVVYRVPVIHSLLRYSPIFDSCNNSDDISQTFCCALSEAEADNHISLDSFRPDFTIPSIRTNDSIDLGNNICHV